MSAKTLALTLAVAAVLAPAGLAGTSSQVTATAGRQCTALRTQVGPAAFRAGFASFDACVVSLRPLARQNLAAAISSCDVALRPASSAFAACVTRFLAGAAAAEQHVLATARARIAAATSAAKACRNREIHGATAFGRCVSVEVAATLAPPGSSTASQTPSPGTPAPAADNCGGSSAGPPGSEIATRCPGPGVNG
jgi:hypothetical protein